VVDGVSKAFAVRRSLTESLRRPFHVAQSAALQDVTFHVSPGEFFGILGPNGAGKTTLLKILATFILPDAGSISVEGIDLAVDPGRARSVVAPVIASERSLYWRLTARENLELFGTLWCVPRRELSARVDETLGLVKLHTTGRKLVGTFSSGMMQRLLIARALLSRPRVLLLDEPTRSLDPVAARDFRTFLRDELSLVRGCAVVIATHTTDEAFGLCDRVAVLHGGRIVAQGEPLTLRRTLAGSAWVLHTRTPGHDAIRAWAATPWSGAREVAAPVRVELLIDGGDDGAAAVLRQLVGSSVDVVGFGPEPGSLATLIEQAIVQGAR
jgi:ABC-2 type transport system ATP-binding protein